MMMAPVKTFSVLIYSPIVAISPSNMSIVSVTRLLGEFLNYVKLFQNQL